MTEEQREIFYAAAILKGSGPGCLSVAWAVADAIALHAEVHRATDPRNRYKNLPEENRPQEGKHANTEHASHPSR